MYEGMTDTFRSPQFCALLVNYYGITEKCACKRMTPQLHSVSGDIIARDHRRQARATRVKETTSGVSHSFSVPKYLPDLNSQSFACGHRPLSASRERVKRG